MQTGGQELRDTGPAAQWCTSIFSWKYLQVERRKTGSDSQVCTSLDKIIGKGSKKGKVLVIAEFHKTMSFVFSIFLLSLLCMRNACFSCKYLYVQDTHNKFLLYFGMMCAGRG